jgi:fluoride exporter
MPRRARATTKMTAPAQATIGSPFATMRTVPSRPQWSVLAAVSAGGVAGALARFAITTAWPNPPNGFPWATFVINVTGCLLIGVLMVAIAEVWPRRRLLRPFLGTGVLGGYTTFSTYVVDAQHLLDQRAGTALVYLFATLVSALLAVYTGTGATRLVIAYTHRTRENRA